MFIRVLVLWDCNFSMDTRSEDKIEYSNHSKIFQKNTIRGVKHRIVWNYSFGILLVYRQKFKKTWKIHLVLCLENGWTSCFAHLTCTIRIEIRIRTFLEPNIPPVREIFEKNRDNITIYGNNSDSVGCLGKKTIFVLFVFKCVFHSLFA